MFWSIIGALVILAALEPLVDWRVPPELQLADALKAIVGGVPSLYGYERAEGDELRAWLSALIYSAPPTLRRRRLLEFSRSKRFALFALILQHCFLARSLQFAR